MRLRRDKMETAELKAHDAKLRNCEGSGEEEAVGRKAAGAQVNMVQEEALTSATTRLASQGIASFGQQETQKIRNFVVQDSPKLSPVSWGAKGMRLATESSSERSWTESETRHEEEERTRLRGCMNGTNQCGRTPWQWKHWRIFAT